MLCLKDFLLDILEVFFEGRLTGLEEMLNLLEIKLFLRVGKCYKALLRHDFLSFGDKVLEFKLQEIRLSEPK